MPGDEVVCEIDGLGRLVNTIVGGRGLRPLRGRKPCASNI